MAFLLSAKLTWFGFKLICVPEVLKIASSASKSALSEIPQVSSAAPGSGFVKFRLVVYVSAI